MSQNGEVREINIQELEDELNDIAGGAQKTSNSSWPCGVGMWPADMPNEVETAILTEAAQAGSDSAKARIIRKRTMHWIKTHADKNTESGTYSWRIRPGSNQEMNDFIKQYVK